MPDRVYSPRNARHHRRVITALGQDNGKSAGSVFGQREIDSLLGPIFVREWLTIPRRASHYVLRSAYLGLLWVLGLTAWQATVGWSRTATLGDNARFGVLLFQVFTIVQLTLLLFFSALSAASAIAQEKDRRTFVLLLMTDLRSYEIVLGKLFGSLLQILLFLIGMLPVLTLLMFMGGVAPDQVAQAGLVIGSAAIAAGSLGGLIALWREKTFQVLALTVLFMVLYLCVVRGLPVVAAWAPVQAAEFLRAAPSWLDPFEALHSVLEGVSDESSIIVPAYGFSLLMLGLSVALNAWGIARLRVWNPSGEPIMQRELPSDAEEQDRTKAHAAPGAAREVWANPVLWREMRTRAYGRRPLLVKLAYGLVLALIGVYALEPVFSLAGRGGFAAAYGLVPVAVLSFLLVSAQSVTAITSERDCGALDLLLVTDLTPQEFIFGKLMGIVYNTKEYILPPLILTVVYALYGWLATPPMGHLELTDYKNGEAAVCVSVASIVLLGFVTVLGIHVALRNINSRLAIMHTLGTVFFLSVGTMVCIYLIVINGRFEYQWTSFGLFTFCGILGMLWVLCGDRPSAALVVAGWTCPMAILYTVMNVLIGKPGSDESADPLIPFVVVAGVFGFTIAAMLVPLLSEFDVALGRTTAGGE